MFNTIPKLNEIIERYKENNVRLKSLSKELIKENNDLREENSDKDDIIIELNNSVLEKDKQLAAAKDQKETVLLLNTMQEKAKQLSCLQNELKKEKEHNDALLKTVAKNAIYAAKYKETIAHKQAFLDGEKDVIISEFIKETQTSSNSMKNSNGAKNKKDRHRKGLFRMKGFGGGSSRTVTTAAESDDVSSARSVSVLSNSTFFDDDKDEYDGHSNDGFNNNVFSSSINKKDVSKTSSSSSDDVTPTMIEASTSSDEDVREETEGKFVNDVIYECDIIEESKNKYKNENATNCIKKETPNSSWWWCDNGTYRQHFA